MADTIYLEGVRMFPPTDGVPDFVKGSGVIAINKLVKFLKDNPNYMSDYKGEPQVKFQLLEGRNGLYFTVDTYKKNKAGTGRVDSPYIAPEDKNDDDSQNLPF